MGKTVDDFSVLVTVLDHMTGVIGDVDCEVVDGEFE